MEVGRAAGAGAGAEAAETVAGTLVVSREGEGVAGGGGTGLVTVGGAETGIGDGLEGAATGAGGGGLGGERVGGGGGGEACMTGGGGLVKQNANPASRAASC